MGKWLVYNSDHIIVGTFEFTDNQVISYDLDTDEKEYSQFEIRGNTIILTTADLSLRFEFINQNSVKFTNPDNNTTLILNRISNHITSLSGKFSLANNVGFLKTIEIIDKSILRLYYDILGV